MSTKRTVKLAMVNLNGQGLRGTSERESPPLIAAIGKAIAKNSEDSANKILWQIAAVNACPK